MGQHELSLLVRTHGAYPVGEPPRLTALLELIEVRRLFEPAAAALAADRVTDGDVAVLAARLEAMSAARDDIAAFTAHDVAFHRAMVSATKNDMLMTLLDEVSAHDVLAELPHGALDRDAVDVVLAEHAAIHATLKARDPTLAHAAALLHVNTTGLWLRRHLRSVRSPRRSVGI